MDYPVHQGKLNLHHPISASSGSRASVFTMVGFMSEGPEEVYYLRCLTSLRCSSVRISSVGSGREWVMG